MGETQAGALAGVVTDESVAELLDSAWRPRFPSPDMVHAAAAMLPADGREQGREGPTWRIRVTPGVVGVSTRDEARYERTQERLRAARRATVDAMTTWLANGEEVPERTPCREITGWSRKSRARMWETLASLDYTPMFQDRTRLPAMVTLTYSGDWLTVAPDGRTSKEHFEAWRKRYERAFGERLLCVWKLEFQGRGAPHYHVYMSPPRHAANDGRYFKQWLSETWADVVSHPDPEERRKHVLAGTGVDYAEGLRATDPRQIATYFSKHGSFSAKEYQNCVPAEWRQPGKGPGRFWGYRGLEKVQAARQVSPGTGTTAGRVLRRWSHAQRVTHQTTRPRVRGGRVESKYGEVIGLAGAYLVESRRTRYRKSRTRAVRCRNGRGWVMVNDGPAFAVALAVALAQQREDQQREQDRRELQRIGVWDSPVARARRLQPGPRRDALLARLENRPHLSPRRQ